MFGLFRKILRFISVGSIPVMIACCYGVAREMDVFLDVTVKDKSNEPISGLKVCMRTSNRIISDDETDHCGNATLNWDPSYYNYPLLLTSSDIDGTSNGFYHDQTNYIYESNENGAYKVIMENR